MSGWEGSTMTLEEHVRILHDLLRRDHEEWVAEVQGWADAARERGDAVALRRNLDYLALMAEDHKPWEPKE